MSAFVEVPKDLSKVQTKVMFGLTKRQLIGFGVAAALGAPTYFGLRGVVGNDIAMIALVIVALPPVIIALYSKDGIPAEEIVKSYLIFKFLRPGARKYHITKENYHLERGGIKKNGSTKVNKTNSKQQSSTAKKAAQKSRKDGKQLQGK